MAAKEELPVVCRAEVEAPVGKGIEDTVTLPKAFVPEGKGLFGDKPTTKAVLAAVAATDAPVIDAPFVPSVTLTEPMVAVPPTKPTVPPVACIGLPRVVLIVVKAVLPVVCKEAVEAPVGKGKAEAETAWVDGKLETETLPIALEPAGKAGRLETLTELKGVSVLNCAAVNTTGTEPDAVA